MKTRYGVSPWTHEFPNTRRPAFARYRGERVADVVIVGGGLTGCATAYACAVAGLTPVLLERERIGQGHTGRSAGLLLAVPGPAFRDIAATHGLRAAKQGFTAWRRAALEGAALIRKLGLKCGLQPAAFLHVGDLDQEKMLVREHKARVDGGLDAAWLGQKQVERAARLEGRLGMRTKDAYLLDPYRACVGLAAAAKRRGAVIHERSAVRRVRFGQKGVEVTTEGGVVRAANVVVATGVATAEFKPLRRHFRFRERYGVLTEPLPASVRREVAGAALVQRDSHVPPRGVRWAPDHRLLISGADQHLTPPRRRDAVLVQRTGQLMYELLTMYPAISGLKPAYGWEATYGDTVDGLMYIGAHRNYPNHLFALGGSPDSLTGAFLAARIVLRALKGRSEKGDAVFGWTR